VIQEALFARLSGHSGVSALTGTRIYPLVIPQQSYDEVTRQPCVVYQMNGRGRQVRFAGTGDLVAGSVQVDAYARTYAQAQALAAALRDALMDYSGVVILPGSPQRTVTIKKCFLDREFDLMDEEPGLYRVSQEYAVWHLE
jgi:hypothetical protein